MRTTKMLCTGFAGLLALTLLPVFQAGAQTPPYVRLSNGQVIEGTSVRVKLDNSVTIEKEGVTRTFTADQVTEAVAARPAEMTQVGQMVQAGQYDQAIPVLEKVARDYRGLSWDIQALKLLGEVQLKKGDAASAVSTFDKLFRQSPKAEENPDVKLSYFDALIAAGQYDRLDSKLDQFAASGTREQAARAQVIRGDAKAAQGQLDEALLDYLRTAHFFKREAEQAALGFLKAGEVLEKLNDKGRAKEVYRMLVEQYPGSEAAAKAKSRI